MAAIALFADFAFFTQPPQRPTRHEPVRDRRPRASRLRRAIGRLWVAPRERYIPQVLRNYPY